MRSHQIESRDLFVKSTRIALGDEMRVGKTDPACAAALLLGVERPVVVCPAIAKQVWHSAYPQWTGKPFPGGRIFSFEKLIRNPRLVDSLRDADLLIVDEFHHCRNTAARRTKVVMQLANQMPRVWFLSGTPMPNSPLDLYPMLRAVWPDELRKANVSNKGQYLNTFCAYVETPFGIKITGARNVPLLQDILSRVMPLRRTFAEVAPNLPQLQWENVTIDVDPDEAQLAALSLALHPRALEALERGEVPAAAEMATARRILGTLKAPVAAKMLAEELEARDYDKVVVLAYHRDVLDVLERSLGGFGVCRVDGQTSPAQRATEVRYFQEGHQRVFIGQLTAAGQSINLSAAHHVVFVEEDWLPDNNRQAAFRIVNIGKDHPVYARMLYANQDIDHRVRAAIRLRLEMQGEIFNR